MIRSRLALIRVQRRPGNSRRGLLLAGGFAWPCALGRGGVRIGKREGDGASPLATLRAVRLFYRADHGLRPATHLPVTRIAGQGWCDDAGDRNYNRLVPLPYRASHEVMRRADRLYDIVVELDWNRQPAIRGRGSAIFLHVARPGLAPTEGCIALPADRLRRLVARLGPGTRFVLS
jgi:L,D-peptidoglycan transpeptidase YkuD (ErfK/YbiS/YcfS/YnhG family)